jgi:hypothetical protein
MSQHNENQRSVNDEHIDSATPTPSPLEEVQQHQQEMQQGLQQQNQDVENHPQNVQSEVPGQGIPSDIRHHPQRANRSHNS